MTRAAPRRLLGAAALAALAGLLLAAAPAAADQPPAAPPLPAAADSPPAEALPPAEAPPLAPAFCAADFAVPNGWFFTQTADGRTGFDVRDDAAASFWTAFRAFGGVHVLGYPVSRRFLQHGFLVQAFQKVVLQWDPISGSARAANTLDTMHRAGLDDWLEAFRQVPRHQQLPADEGAPFDVVMANHLALLDANPDIRAEFLATPDWLMRLGLPVAYQDFGAVRVLRAQRAVLQQWTVDVPWAQAGEVIFANSGDLAREAGLFPAEAVAPAAPGRPLPDDLELTLDAPAVVQGATLLARLSTGRPDARLSLDGRELPLACVGGAWQSLIGVAADAAPGARRVRLAVGGDEIDHPFDVAPGEFASFEFTLDSSLAHLLDPQTSAQELAFIQGLTDRVTGPPRWTGALLAPADGWATSPYGQRRVLHPGAVQAVHRGADVAAPLGAEVAAAADGQVVWAGTLQIYGDSVVLDHGFGVYSLAAHLSQTDVTAGDVVTSGQRIGAVGNSGRSTGPHLHWEVHVTGVAVDPAAWMQQAFVGDAWTGYLGPTERLPAAPAGQTPDALPTPNAGAPRPSSDGGESPPAGSEGDAAAPPAEQPSG